MEETPTMDRKEYLKEYYKKYYKEHRNEWLASGKQYYDEHRKEISAYKKQWYEQNKEKKDQQTKAWMKSHIERWREIERKVQSKRRRGLDFIPLNEWFEGCEAHHVDKERVIYIPKEIHQSIRHNVWTGENMDEINALAFNYLKI